MKFARAATDQVLKVQDPKEDEEELQCPTHTRKPGRCRGKSKPSTAKGGVSGGLSRQSTMPNRCSAEGHNKEARPRMARG